MRRLKHQNSNQSETKNSDQNQSQEEPGPSSRTNVTNDKQDQNQTAGLRKKELIEPDDSFASRIPYEKRKYLRPNSLIRIKSKQAVERSLSKRWIDNSRSAFISDFTGQESSNRPNYLAKTAGKRDADILGISSRTNVTNDEQNQNQTAGISKKGIIEPDDSFASRIPDEKRKYLRPNSLIRIKSKQAVERSLSKRWVDNSHSTFIRDFTGQIASNRPNYLAKTAGRRDADILGIDISTFERNSIDDSKNVDETKKQKKTVQLNVNYVKIIQYNYPKFLKFRFVKMKKSMVNLLKTLDSLEDKKPIKSNKKSLLKKLFMKSSFVKDKNEILLDRGAGDNYAWNITSKEDICNLPQFQHFINNIYNDIIEWTQKCFEPINESHNSITQLIQKYIEDPEIVNELTKKLQQHSNLLAVKETQTWNTIQNLQLKQLTYENEQKTNLFQIINSILNNNKNLQQNLHVQQQRNEMLLIDLVLQKQNRRKITKKKLKEYSRLHEINELLRHRLTSATEYIENLHDEIVRIKENNIILNKTVNDLRLKIINQNEIITKSKNDYNIEISIMNNKIRQKHFLIDNINKSIKNLFNEFEVLKNTSPIIKTHLEQSNITSKNTIELITLSKSCLNLLIRELLLQQKRNVIPNLIEITNETNQYLSDSPENKKHLTYFKQKLENLLRSYQLFQQATNRDKSIMLKKLKEYQTKIQNLTADKVELSSKLKTNDYFKIQSENQLLTEQLKKYTEERTQIVNYQNKYYNYVLKLHDVLEKQRKQNGHLKDDLNAQYKIYLLLQTENKVLKQNLNSYQKLPALIQHKQNSIKELECNIRNMQIEQSKLVTLSEIDTRFQTNQKAIVAEFQKSVENIKNTLIDMTHNQSSEIDFSTAQKTQNIQIPEMFREVQIENTKSTDTQDLENVQNVCIKSHMSGFVSNIAFE